MWYPPTTDIHCNLFPNFDWHYQVTSQFCVFLFRGQLSRSAPVCGPRPPCATSDGTWTGSLASTCKERAYGRSSISCTTAPPTPNVRIVFSEAILLSCSPDDLTLKLISDAESISSNRRMSREHPLSIIHYGFTDEKKLSSWEACFVPLDRSWVLLSKNPDHHRWRTNRQAKKKEKKKYSKITHLRRLLRFRSLLLLILLGVFLAFSSLGAGSNEQTRTVLGAHQRRFRSQ